MREMPGFCCTLQRCKVPKKDWATVPPCDVCGKAIDTAAAVAADEAMDAQQHYQGMSDYLREVLTEERLWKPICKALVDRAIGGDLKAIEFIMTALGEKPGDDLIHDLRVVFGPGAEELAR